MLVTDVQRARSSFRLHDRNINTSTGAVTVTITQLIFLGKLAKHGFGWAEHQINSKGVQSPELVETAPRHLAAVPRAEERIIEL